MSIGPNPRCNSSHCHGRLRTVCQLGLLILAAALIGGCGNESADAEERHPYYVRALRLIQDRDYQGAAAALERCLQLSPAAAKAHLRLAMLYEDHLDQPVQAILHYRQFLQKRPGDAESATVRAWVERVEKQYGQMLLSLYPDLQEAPHSPPAAPSPDTPAALPAAAVTARELALAEQVKALNRQLASLKQELRVVRQAAPRSSVSAAVKPSPARPPAPPNALPSSDNATSYIVRKGDTLSNISRDFYGTAKYWPALQQANIARLNGGTALAPGMVLAIPPADEIALVQQARQPK